MEDLSILVMALSGVKGITRDRSRIDKKHCLVLTGEKSKISHFVREKGLLMNVNKLMDNNNIFTSKIIYSNVVPGYSKI